MPFIRWDVIDSNPWIFRKFDGFSASHIRMPYALNILLYRIYLIFGLIFGILFNRIKFIILYNKFSKGFTKKKLL